MKILIDTCVILDVLENRKGFVEDSKKLFLMTAQNKIESYITACSIKDIYYLFHRYNHSNEKSLKAISSLLKLFNIIDVNGDDLASALALDMNDYEDAVVAQSCVRHDIDYIVTRNIKDFYSSPVPAILPSQIK